MDIGKQRILITGGTRGIGLELARALMHKGAAVAVCGRSASAPAAVTELGGGVAYFQADLSVPGAAAPLAERVREEFGAPTVLVNNAGVQFNHDWGETDVWDRLAWAQRETTLNVLAPQELTALFLDDLMAAPAAAVVNVTSILALAPKASAPVYSASKAALRSFTKGLRYQMDHARGQVRVVEVLPPVVDTGMTAGRGSDKMDPADVAEAIVRGLEAGHEEIWVGKARLVRVLNRLAPRLVAGILKTS